MIDDDIFTLQNKVSASERRLRLQKSQVKQIILELKWTDYLQSKLECCNLRYFKNFQLRLVMEEDKMQCSEFSGQHTSGDDL